MKTRLCLALAILFCGVASYADDSASGFLLRGRRYTFIYALDQKAVLEQHLPTLVTVVGPVGGGWYVVKPIDRDVEYRVNVNNLIAITELPE